MAGVVLSGITKRYGDLEVVHGIDLEIGDKEFVVLVGPSGCGKSTTLRMIAGLEEVSAGRIDIGGRVVNEIAPKDRDIAMVFQNYALYPHLNVAKNIAFGLNIRRVPRAETDRLVAEVADTLELTDYLDRKPGELSGGQRQRVAMGRAIVRNPEVFLFDEPLSNLDAKLRTQMRAEIKKLHRRLGATSIYVTHDQVEAMTLADRIVVMQDGMIEQIGTPMELFNDPANLFVASFMGSPPMNKLRCELTMGNGAASASLGDKGRIEIPLTDGDAKRANGTAVLGIRPEHVSVEPKGDAGWHKVACEVSLVEPLGSEALVHAQVNGEIFIIKSETTTGLGHLDSIDAFYVHRDHIYLFDAERGQRIGRNAFAGAAQ